MQTYAFIWLLMAINPNYYISKMDALDKHFTDEEIVELNNLFNGQETNEFQVIRD